MMKISLVGQSSEDASPAVSVQASVNVFAQLIGDQNEAQKNKAILVGRPGKHLLASLGLADVRGLWSGAGRLFVAAGLSLLELNQSGGIVSNYAYAASDDGLPVQIFSNGNQLLIITAGRAYCDNGAGPVACVFSDASPAGTVIMTVIGSVGFVTWETGDQFLTDGSWTGLTITIAGFAYTIVAVPSPTNLEVAIGANASGAYSLSAPSVVTAVTGAYLDGTFFVQRPPTSGQINYGRQVNFSSLLDGTQWSSLDFFSKESSPDAIRGIYADNEQLYVAGAESIEEWMSNPNATANQTPYSRVNATSRFGMISAWGMVSLDGRIFFVGGDDRGGPVAYVMNGFTPVRISTHGIEAQWNEASLGSNCVTYAYEENGMSFFVINFGSQTWAYDTELGAWHQRVEWNGTEVVPYQTNLHTFLPEWTVAGQTGVHVTAGTGASGADVYVSSIAFYDDAGQNIWWQRVLPYLYAGGLRQYFARMVLEMEAGTAAAGTPAVTLDYSDDRGATFINPRPFNTGIATDPTAMRLWINRNGSSRGRIFRLTGVGQKKIVLIDLEVDMVTGVV